MLLVNKASKFQQNFKCIVCKNTAIFAEKKRSAKAFLILSAKITSKLDFMCSRKLNKASIDDVIKLMML